MRRFKTKNYLFFGFIFALIIFARYLGWLDFIANGARLLLAPISTTINRWHISFSDSYNYFSDKNNVVSKYNQCVADNQNLATANVSLKSLEQENIELRKLLNFSHRRNFTMVTAEVVGKNTNSAEKMIIIDAGESTGIKIGQPVIVGDGILVGTIAKAEPSMSMVRLINDNQSKIAATILNKNGSLGVVEGGYGLSVRMNFIPRNEEILIGEKIITSGLEQNMPRGLLIGEVAVAENEAYQPFQQAVLTPATDLSRLIVVSVLISN